MFRKLMVGLAWAGFGAAAPAWGQATVAGVLDLEGIGHCDTSLSHATPGLLWTSLGAVEQRAQGQYGSLCLPELLEVAVADLQRSTDGTTFWALGVDGSVYEGANGFCDMQPLPVQGTVRQILRFRDALWILADDGQGSADLLRHIDGRTASVLHFDDRIPQGMWPGGDDLWLAGALPEPSLLRLGLAGGLQPEWVTDLPSVDGGVDSVRPVGFAQGDVFLRVERGRTTWSWVGREQRVSGGVNAVVVKELDGRPSTFVGPVWVDNRWYSIQDGALMSYSVGGNAWQDTGHLAAHRCLMGVGQHAFGCTPSGLERLSVAGDGSLAGDAVFAFQQIEADGLVCGRELPTCAERMAADLRAAGFDPDRPAVCPDGTTARELHGAGCRTAPGPGGFGTLVLLVLPLLRRRITNRVY